jgi:hypothetical protein
MLDMSQAEVADRAKVSIPTIDGPLRGTYGTVAAVIGVLEAAGIEFTNGDDASGVKIKAG